MIGFTLTREQTDGASEPKRLTLKLGAKKGVTIGRAPGNDVIVTSRGVSQYHAELRFIQAEGDSSPKLHIRDLSMNGTGLKRSASLPPTTLDKRVDVHVPDASVILVPMMLKVSQQTGDRAWLKVDYLDESEVAAEPPAGETNGKKHSKAAAPAAEGSDASGDGEGNGNKEEDSEKSRMKFVELLLKTKEISAGTTYEAAKKLLCASGDWHAVDENTRKECFDIFVEHLGSHQSSKKKDKKKGKDKEKSKKNKRDDSAGAAVADDAKAPREEKKQKKDRRGDRSNDGSADGRKRRRTDKRGRRSRSRGGRSGSGGASPPRDKRRRRGRSGSP